MKTKNSVLAFAGLALATGFASLGHAQTASDVSCTKCVDTSDIANNAITTGRIKNGSVTNADLAFDAITSNRIRNGTVSNADLAPNAITSSRIKNGSITNADIASDNITGNRIKNGSLTGVDLADGSVTTDDIADNSVTTDDLADGSITEQDIADGTITAAKLAGDAIYRNIYLVRADALDPAGNCQRIADILATFPAMNLDPALIKLEPGVYDCSNGGTASGLVMKDFVDIEGSGQGTTVIQGDATNDGQGVVQTAANAELRYLTIDNVAVTGTHAIWAPQLARLSFVTLDAADGNGANETIDCSGNSDTPPVVVSNSIVTSNDQATFSCNAGAVFVASQIAATQGFGSSGNICHASFDGTYVAFDNSCASIAPPPFATSQPANSDSRSRR